MSTTQENARLARVRRQLQQAFRPFTRRQVRPVQLRVWPGTTKTALISVKPSLFRQWEHDGWLRRGVLMVCFDSVVPLGRLRPMVAAITTLTKRMVYIGDLDPLELAIFVRLQSVVPASVRLTYGGIDDEWLAKERESRSGSGTPYYVMRKSQVRLWRALKAAHPSIVKLIGPNATAVLDRGNCLAVEGACGLGWHGPAMFKFAFRRAMSA